MGIELVIHDCCEKEEIVPQKKYFGGQEGVGEYVWYRTKTKLDVTDLIDISEECEGVSICSKTLYVFVHSHVFLNF